MERNQYYRLNEKHEVEKCSWEQYCEDSKKRNHPYCHRIKVSWSKDKRVRVSTIFLAIMHIGGIFETMYFIECDPLDLGVKKLRKLQDAPEQERCNTYNEAIKQHDKMCNDISKIIKQKFIENEH